jgi:hypothetical protein
MIAIGITLGLSMIDEDLPRLQNECIPAKDEPIAQEDDGPAEGEQDYPTPQNDSEPAGDNKNIDIKPDSFNLSQIKDSVTITAEADKRAYYSYDPVDVSVTVYSAYNVSDCYVRAYGIENSFGTDKMRQSVKTDITEGESSFTLSDRIPGCYSCDFIEPGEFEITAWVQKDNVRLAETELKIEIKDD